MDEGDAASAGRTRWGCSPGRSRDRSWLVHTSRGQPFEAGSQAKQAEGPWLEGPELGWQQAPGCSPTPGHLEHRWDWKLQLGPQACRVFPSSPTDHSPEEPGTSQGLSALVMVASSEQPAEAKGHREVLAPRLIGHLHGSPRQGPRTRSSGVALLLSRAQPQHTDPEAGRTLQACLVWEAWTDG